MIVKGIDNYSALEIATINKNMLTLVYSKISKNIQTIEQLLSTNKLDFVWKNLSAQDISIIVSFLNINKTLFSLDLKFNNIGDLEVHNLAKVLEHNITLNTLYLSGNEIGDDGAKDLANALKKNTLRILQLYSNNIQNLGKEALYQTQLHNKYIQIHGIDDSRIHKLNNDHKINYDKMINNVKAFIIKFGETILLKEKLLHITDFDDSSFTLDIKLAKIFEELKIISPKLCKFLLNEHEYINTIFANAKVFEEIFKKELVNINNKIPSQKIHSIEILFQKLNEHMDNTCHVFKGICKQLKQEQKVEGSLEFSLLPVELQKHIFRFSQVNIGDITKHIHDGKDIIDTMNVVGEFIDIT